MLNYNWKNKIGIMYELEHLTAIQLEWLEAVKYDEYLDALNNYKSKPNQENLISWDEKEREYLIIVNHISSNSW